jgi:hypothetical protein
MSAGRVFRQACVDALSMAVRRSWEACIEYAGDCFGRGSAFSGRAWAACECFKLGYAPIIFDYRIGTHTGVLRFGHPHAQDRLR